MYSKCVYIEGLLCVWDNEQKVFGTVRKMKVPTPSEGRGGLAFSDRAVRENLLEEVTFEQTRRR